MDLTQPIEYLHRAYQRFPKRLAVSSADAELTFEELFDTVLRFARVLRESGIRPAQLVATKLPPLLDIAISFALFHESAVGGCLTPDVSSRNLEQFDWIISDVPSKMVASDKLIIIDQAFLNRAALLEPHYEPQEYPSRESLSRVSFSSGTTGEPKLIPWSLECLIDRAITRQGQWMLGSPYLCLLGLSTGLGFMTLLAQVSRGETYVHARKDGDILTQIEKFGIRCVMASPHQLGEMLRAARSHAGLAQHIPLIMSAGSELPIKLADQLTETFGAKLVSTYASSESGSVSVRVIGSETEREEPDSNFVGKVLDDVAVIVIDHRGEQLPDGQIGRIGIKRAMQPLAYIGDDEASATSFRGGYFFPGDLGFQRGRYLYVVGRSQEIIDMGGIKINPARVESIALGFHGIEDAVAFPLSNFNGITEIALAFTSSSHVDPEALMLLMFSHLGEASPRSLFKVKEITRNHMGKVNRQQIAQSVNAHYDRL